MTSRSRACVLVAALLAAGPAACGGGSSGGGGAAGGPSHGGAAGGGGRSGTGGAAGNGLGGAEGGGAGGAVFEVPCDSHAELPRAHVDTRWDPPKGGTTHAVGPGGDLQAALDAAQPGDIVEIAAGETYTGNFRLRAKSGSGPIYVVSSALDRLPPPGRRVVPSDARNMPKIVSASPLPAIAVEKNADGYRLVGLEVTTTHDVTTSTFYNVIRTSVDDAAPWQHVRTREELSRNIVFDRLYVHGTPNGNVRAGIMLDGAGLAVVDSYLSGFHEIGEAQAIITTNSAGPLKIVNDYLEGSGENVMLGGGDPAISGLEPADVEIRNNHVIKPLTWKETDPSYAGIRWTVKNLLELKNARRVLVWGNVFEGNVLFGDTRNDASLYPPGSFHPRSLDEVGFADAASGDYGLAADSSYAGKATDGTDPGIRPEALDAATACVVGGTCGSD